MDIKSLWQKLDQIAESSDVKSISEEKKKKPDADGDGVPDWADKKPGEDDNEDKKKVEEDVAEEVDTGEYDARKSQPSSKEEQDKVFAKHKERMKNLDKEDVAEAAPELKNVKHFAKAGGYGRKIDKDDDSGDKFHSSDIDDTDDEKSAPAAKRGRGRPMKGGDSDTGIVKKYDTDTLASWIIGNKPKNIGKIGTVSKVHRLKEYMSQVETHKLIESVVSEGKMSEVTAILQDIVDGHIDIYDIIMDKYVPTNQVEKFVADKLKKKYEEYTRYTKDDGGPDAMDRIYNELEDILSGSQPLEEINIPGTTAAAATTAGTTAGTTTGTTTGTPAAGQQSEPAKVMAGGKIVATAPTPQAASQATPIVTRMQNDEKTLAKLGISKVAESLSDTMNKFSSILNESHDRQNLSESKTPELIMEGTLEEIIAVHPHEHKMCQEGWGMDESLYEALCDHYYKEGRIPRKVWHGSSDDLRKCVEECYLKDTNPLIGEEVDEGSLSDVNWKDVGASTAGSVGGYMAGDAIGGPLAGLAGSAVGGALGSAFAKDDEVKEDDDHEVAAGLGGAALGGGLGYAAGSGALDGVADAAMGLLGLEEDDMEEGFVGGALGGAAGAALTKSPRGAIAGAKLGSAVQDRFAKKSPFETEEKDIRRHAMSRLIDKLDESTYGKLKNDMNEAKKPSAGMTAGAKSDLVKKAKAGKDIGKPGKGFEKLAKKAGEKYGSAEKGKKVAAAAMWKNAAPTTESKEDDFDAAAIAQGKRGRAARDNPMATVALAKKSPAAQAAKQKVADYHKQHDEPVKKLDEKFGKEAKLNPEKKGMFKGKTKAELQKQLSNLKKTGPHKKGSAEYTKQNELEFAIRAKSGWGKVEESVEFSSWDSQLSSLLNPISKPVVAESTQTNKKMIAESTNELSTMLQFAGLKNVESVMEELNASIYADESSENFEKSNDEETPVLAMPRGMGMSHNSEEDQESTVVDPMMNDEVIDGLTDGSKESDQSDDDHLSFFKKMLSHGQSEVKVESGEQSGIPASTSQSAISGETSKLPVTKEEKIEEGMTEDLSKKDSENEVKSLAREFMGMNRITDVNDLNPEDVEMLASEAMISPMEFAEILGITDNLDQYEPRPSSDDIDLDEDEMEEGNAFTGALAKAKADGIQPGETMTVGGKEYPVKEEVVSTGNGDDQEEQSEVSSDAVRDAGLAQGDKDFFSSENSSTMAECDDEMTSSDPVIGDLLQKLAQLIGGEQSTPTVVDVEVANSDYAEENPEHVSSCDQCGESMYEGHQCMESLNEWANSPEGQSADEQFETDMEFMTKVISGGLNNQKQDQTTLPSTRVVTQDERKETDNTIGAMLRKLSGIN